MLRAKKPTLIQKRFKVLLFGDAGVGKTTCAINFPKPYLIDTERGAENTSYVKRLDERGGVVYQTSNYDDILTEVKSLAIVKHEYKTLIIDSLTPVYDALLIECEKLAGTAYSKQYILAAAKMKHLFDWLLRLDMNVICTAHSKAKYNEPSTNNPDGYKKMDYIFDLVLEVRKAGVHKNIDRFALVTKTRMPESFEENERIEFSYETIASKYGKDILENECKPIELASKDEVEMLLSLIKRLEVQPSVIDGWFKKVNVNSFEEFEKKDINKIIDSLNKKIKNLTKE